MSTNFQVKFTRHNGNLHVHPKGDIDGSSAWQLIRLLGKKYDGRGEVIVNTRQLGTILPFGRSTFKGQIHLSRIPASRLFFKGEKAPDLAPNGSKILTSSGKHHCKCKGNCALCPCSYDKHRATRQQRLHGRRRNYSDLNNTP